MKLLTLPCTVVLGLFVEILVWLTENTKPRSLSSQEVRTADNVVAIPAGTRHPTVQQPELCALHYLGLSYPFAGCPDAGVCGDPRSCFKCHETVSMNMQTMVAEARFAPVWKNWQACLRTRQEAARMRLAGSLSVPAIRDCVLCREWFPLNDNGPDVELQRKEAASYMLSVVQLFRRNGRKVSPRDGIDLLRVFECLCSYLGVAPGFHASQLTPFEYMSLKQLLWLERYKQHQLARQSSSSRRRAERFKYIQDLDQNADVEAYD